jgi:hypothetical protein
MNGQDVRAYQTTGGSVAFGPTTPEAVVGLEAAFPDGRWVEDAHGTPVYEVKALRYLGIVTVGAPPMIEDPTMRVLCAWGGAR